MKKKLFYYLFAVLCTATLFTSCSDDDDEVKYPIDTELAGGYVGNLSVNVDGNQMGTTENQKITISQSNKETNQIALSLKNFTFLVNVCLLYTSMEVLLFIFIRVVEKCSGIVVIRVLLH